ncbi:MAG: response regulator [Armatimonadota bacterium]|nr:response regulator [Armatimonadota bacterium]
MKNGKKVILCVDDDRDILEQLRLILEANGYSPLLAENAQAGLVLFKRQPPDLLIVDLMMEDLDAGLNFIRKLNELGNTAPVFMLSSVGDQLYDQLNASELKIRGIFQKPIDPGNLLSTLKVALG